MPLPSHANLTSHWDASVDTNIWEQFQSTTPYHNTQASDGSNVEVWDDVDGNNMMFTWKTSDTTGPTYQVNTPLMLNPCLDFEASEQLFSFQEAGTGGTGVPASTFFGAGAKTIIVAVYVESISTTSGNTWTNNAIIKDSAELMGLHLRTSGGQPKLQAYNWDGNNDTVEIDIAVDTSYIACLRHDGTNLYVSINGGSESSVTSGNTTSLTGQLEMASQNADIRIGEMATYNAALTGTDLSDALDYFIEKWITGPVASTARAYGIIIS
jgi:hypothetical protein